MQSMITKLGSFPLHIVETADSAESEATPFSYSVVIKTTEDKRAIICMCNDIPCSMCELSDTCKNGAHRNDAISAYIKENCPEIYI